MKKSLLMIAALFAAITLNARIIDIDLAQGQAHDAELSLANDELTVNYELSAWDAGGVIFALDNLDVTELAFEYIGDASIEYWVSLLVYLEDSEGGWWYSSAADLSISSWNAEWAAKNFMPSDVLWETSFAAEPLKPFKALGFIANPGQETQASFAIRNVKLTVPGDETALENITAQDKTTKVIRNGQVLFIRDGKTFNALGAEIK